MTLSCSPVYLPAVLQFDHQPVAGDRDGFDHGIGQDIDPLWKGGQDTSLPAQGWADPTCRRCLVQTRYWVRNEEEPTQALLHVLVQLWGSTRTNPAKKSESCLNDNPKYLSCDDKATSERIT